MRVVLLLPTITWRTSCSGENPNRAITLFTLRSGLAGRLFRQYVRLGSRNPDVNREGHTLPSSHLHGMSRLQATQILREVSLNKRLCHGTYSPMCLFTATPGAVKILFSVTVPRVASG